MSATLDTLDEVFTALADRNRRDILQRLVQNGEGTATSLAADLPISRQAVMKHLTQLDRARLVSSRKIGREVLYQAEPDELSDAARTMEAIAVDWDRTLVMLKRIAEESSQ